MTLLRGAAVSAILRAFGIDPRRYWLLMDLFDRLSERREMLSQLGRDGVTLKTVAGMYFVLAGLFSLLVVPLRPPLVAYFWFCQAITAFLSFSILLPETSNSLVSPVESLVLAHYPINGATYTAAKLSHLVRILLFLVPGLNAVPSLAGLLVQGTNWTYPVVHLLAAYAAGLLAALLSCALFGWLIRLLPAPRLKFAAQMAEMLPWLGFVLVANVRPWLSGWTVHVDIRSAAVVLSIAGVAAVVFGIRSLSVDYLVRVGGIVQGGSRGRARTRTSWIGAVAARWFGGQGSRAGAEYVARMVARDWQFRRQCVPTLVFTAPLLVGSGWRISPFSGRFTPLHLMPHVFGFLLLWVCVLLVYGADYKGAWIFLLAPAGTFGRFARGVHAWLWLALAVGPHAVLFFVFVWSWGFADAALFTAYSIAVVSLYLGVELRLIDGVPFGRQADPSRSVFMMPLMIAAGIAIGAAVALQYFVLFRSVERVLIAAAIVGAVALLVTRSSIGALQAAIRFHRGVLSVESGDLYKEVG